MEDITDVDLQNRHTKQCLNTLLLADVFEDFRHKCIEIYERDPAHF